MPAFGGTTEFTADLQTLNADFGSTASGQANLTLNDDNPMMPTLRVQIQASGLQDLTAFPGAVHLAHIHGQFPGNATQPLPQQLDGPFFEGNGGNPIESTVPTAADDGGRLVDEPAVGLSPNRFLDFFEGLPDYGPVNQNLSSTQLPSPPDGVSPSQAFVNGVLDGTINPEALFPKGTDFILDTTYTYDLSDEDQARQFNNTIGEDGEALALRVIVLHGLTVPTDISDAIDQAAGVPAGNPQAGVPLGDGTSFRLVAPVAAGDIMLADGGGGGGGGGGNGGTVIPLPAGVWGGMALLSMMGVNIGRKRFTRKA